MGHRGAVALALACLVGCGGARTDAGYEGALRSRDVARGEEVFTYICAACHNGRVSPEDYDWTPGQMRRQVREGNRLMPPIPDHRVSEDDLEAVLAFLTFHGSLRASLPPPPAEPVVRRLPIGVTPEEGLADAADTQPPETQPPETQPPETQPPETQPPETQPPETQPETQPDAARPAPGTAPLPDRDPWADPPADEPSHDEGDRENDDADNDGPNAGRRLSPPTRPR